MAGSVENAPLSTLSCVLWSQDVHIRCLPVTPSQKFPALIPRTVCCVCEIQKPNCFDFYRGQLTVTPQFSWPPGNYS